MKKKLNPVRLTLITAGSIVAMALLFSACKKSNDGIDNNTTAAAVMGFNLAPDKSSIGISVGGSNLTNTSLGYTSYTGAYLAILPGSREVASYDMGTSAPFATVTGNFEAKKYYSVFTLGANGTYRNLVVEDELDTLSAAGGQAFIRYVNAIPDSTNLAVHITANGADIINSNAAFATVSAFTGVTPGDISIKISNGTTISANRTITLEKAKVYTILLSGIPGSTDSVKLVQIKYITNGAVD